MKKNKNVKNIDKIEKRIGNVERLVGGFSNHICSKLDEEIGDLKKKLL